MAFLIPLGYAVVAAITAGTVGATTAAIIVNSNKKDEIAKLKDEDYL